MIQHILYEALFIIIAQIMPWLCYHRVSQANDQIYAKQDLFTRKLGVEAIMALFTDTSPCVYVYLLIYQLCGWDAGYEKKDSTVITENTFTEMIRNLWGRLQRQNSSFANVMWWDRL